MSYPGPPASSDFPWIDAGGPVPAADTYGTLLPASFRRRRGLLVRGIPSVTGVPAPFSLRRAHSRSDHGQGCPSGVVFSPEGAFPQLTRTEPFSRRHFDAGGAFSYGIPSVTGLPAPFSRRRGSSRSDHGQGCPSGVVFSPEGAFPQLVRTEPFFRRHFDAGGAFSYGIPSVTHRLSTLSQRLRWRRPHPQCAVSVVVCFQ